MKSLPLFGATNRIATQIIALLALSCFVALGCIILIYFVMMPDLEPTTKVVREVTRIATVLRGLEALPAPARAQMLSAYNDREFTARVIDSPLGVPANTVFITERQRSLLVRELPPGARLVAIQSVGDEQFKIIMALSDGQSISFDVMPRDPGRVLPLPLVLMVAFLIASTVLLSIWAARRLVSPLARFAAAVDQFGMHGHEVNLREEGPAEIRQATGAFNRMRERIVRLLEDRTRMLMAISHDLRTPLTRLRLRVEELAEEGQKHRMLEDIELMDASITSAVSYVREGATAEVVEMADLPSLVQTICDQFEDAGHVIVYEGPRRLSVRCLPLALGRALVNLVDNAVKFGSSVTVRLDTSVASRVSIEVEDDGPGIPDSEKPLVLEPFYRTDAARQSVGGFGLGLAIALAVARHHAGTLTLHDCTPHGLRARLSIPVTGPTDAVPGRRVVLSGVRGPSG
jgi:signal transduction histidine kinase